MVDTGTTWKTFKAFRTKSFSFYDAVFPTPVNSENWMKGHCDCPNFYKLFICEHVIGIALRKKWTRAPTKAKSIPIGVVKQSKSSVG